MSIRFASPTMHCRDDIYVVAAPRACDALTATLQAAYEPLGDDVDQFSDLLRQLDMIEILPSRRA